MLGGALGSAFITVNTFMGMCRKKVIKNNASRIIETGLYGLATISVMAVIVISLNTCDDIPECDNCTTEA